VTTAATPPVTQRAGQRLDHPTCTQRHRIPRLSLPESCPSVGRHRSALRMYAVRRSIVIGFELRCNAAVRPLLTAGYSMHDGLGRPPAMYLGSRTRELSPVRRRSKPRDGVGRKLCRSGITSLWSSRLIIVTPTSSASPSSWAATELPQIPQKPRWDRESIVPDRLSAWAVHSNPSRGSRPTTSPGYQQFLAVETRTKVRKVRSPDA